MWSFTVALCRAGSQDAHHVTARWRYIAVALGAASLFATSLWIGTWWTVGDVAIGPMGSRHCFGGDCRPGGLGWIGGSAAWERAAAATWAAGFVAMAALIGLAGGIAAGRLPRLVAQSTLVAIGTVFVAGGYFAFAFPGIGGASIGYGMGLYAVAGVLGLVTPIRVLRQ